MNAGMRRTLKAAAVILAAAMAVASTGSAAMSRMKTMAGKGAHPSGVASGAGTARAGGGCGNKIVFLVWPHGHAAIPRISEFPELRNPHVEVYLGFDSGYDAKFAGAYAVGGKPPAGIGRGGSFGDCLDFGDAVKGGSVAAPRMTIKEQTAVMCTLPGGPVTDVAFRNGGVTDLYVRAGKRILAQAHVTRSSAVLTVIAGHCKLIAPPHP